MVRVDKYGRGSAAANGEGFVDLAPGDTFAALEKYLKQRQKKIYAVEAVEINQDAKSRSTPRGAISEDLNSAPFQDLTSQQVRMVSYCIGDVNVEGYGSEWSAAHSDLLHCGAGIRRLPAARAHSGLAYAGQCKSLRDSDHFAPSAVVAALRPM